MAEAVVVALAGVRGPALEAVTAVRDLTGSTGPTVLVLATPDAQELSALAEVGCTRVLVADLGDAAAVPAVAGRAVVAAVGATGADLVVLPTSFPAKEVAAHAATSLAAGLLVDVEQLRREDGRLVGAKRVFAGSWDTVCAVTTPVAVVTLRANAVVATPAPGPSTPSVQALTVDGTLPDGVEMVERTERPSSTGRPRLAEAATVVAGGRGTEGDFSGVEELADALGAAVGTTRDCVDEGWLGHDAQIGQTGVTIAPRVYIGAGISGAPHHHGGMQGSQVIIAVNADADAPLVQIADFAVIGDMQEILPAAAAAIRERRGR